MSLGIPAAPNSAFESSAWAGVVFVDQGTCKGLMTSWRRKEVVLEDA